MTSDNAIDPLIATYIFQAKQTICCDFKYKLDKTTHISFHTKPKPTHLHLNITLTKIKIIIKLSRRNLPKENETIHIHKHRHLMTISQLNTACHMMQLEKRSKWMPSYSANNFLSTTLLLFFQVYLFDSIVLL